MSRSPVVQKPDHAGAAYWSLDSTVAQNTCLRDCCDKPCPLSTRSAYSSLVQEGRTMKIPQSVNQSLHGSKIYLHPAEDILFGEG